MLHPNKLILNRIKTKLQVKKPWDTVFILILNILITIPFFIILHQQILDPEWFFHTDRILLFLIILLVIHLILSLLKTVLVVCIIAYILVLMISSLTGNYGLSEVSDSYKSMVYTMIENPNPENIIISKLLPFPNKSKILRAIDFENPKVRNFALLATTKHFKKIKGYQKYRMLTQCFAVFKEINQNWNYVNDPKGQEYFANASESLQHFSGDCDDHSILMAACIRAVGGTPRIISTTEHVYPEMLIGSKENFEAVHFLIKEVLFKSEIGSNELHYHQDEYGQIWLNLDYTAKYPGGRFMSEEILGALTLY